MAEPAFRWVLPKNDGWIWPVRGYLYVSPAPSFDHQFAVTRLGRFFDEFVSSRGLGIALVAPFDILLPTSLGRTREPDLVFFRTGNQPRRGDQSFAGIPDLVVEVLSPRTRHEDRRTKFQAYQEAGIPEYWMVDPDSRKVEIHLLVRGSYSEVGRFETGDTVGAVCLPGLRIEVADLFLPE